MDILLGILSWVLTFIENHPILIQGVVGPLVIGIGLYKLGKNDIEKRAKADAIKDLMTFRGDFASIEFRRALNKISVVFHMDEDIRKEVRHLYEVINTPQTATKMTERCIVGLIYKLCQKNGFKGLTEYDIDQAFPEAKQDPGASIPMGQDTPTNPPTSVGDIASSETTPTS